MLWMHTYTLHIETTSTNVSKEYNSHSRRMKGYSSKWKDPDTIQQYEHKRKTKQYNTNSNYKQA